MNSTIIKDLATSWFVRIVHPGERYGLNGCLIHSGEPMVEFYDYGFSTANGYAGFGPRGQFVSRYNVSALSNVTGGLSLYSSEPRWTVSRDAMTQVLEFIAKEIK